MSFAKEAGLSRDWRQSSRRQVRKKSRVRLNGRLVMSYIFLKSQNRLLVFHRYAQTGEIPPPITSKKLPAIYCPSFGCFICMARHYAIFYILMISVVSSVVSNIIFRTSTPFKIRIIMPSKGLEDMKN